MQYWFFETLKLRQKTFRQILHVRLVLVTVIYSAMFLSFLSLFCKLRMIVTVVAHCLTWKSRHDRNRVEFTPIYESNTFLF